MRVEIWSDIVCPFCYIGKRKFEEALRQFAHQDQVHIEYRSFQLDPHTEKKPSIDINDKLSAKYGISREKAIAMNQQVAGQAKEVGLDFHFDHMKPANTLDAHRLIKFAEEFGKTEQMVELLYKAYFTDSKPIGELEILADIAVEAGIDREAAVQLLHDTRYEKEVLDDCDEASRLGARGVPFFVFDRRYAVSGAQPSEVFLDVMEKVASKDGVR